MIYGKINREHGLDGVRNLKNDKVCIRDLELRRPGMKTEIEIITHTFFLLGPPIVNCAIGCDNIMKLSATDKNRLSVSVFINWHVLLPRLGGSATVENGRRGTSKLCLLQ